MRRTGLLTFFLALFSFYLAAQEVRSERISIDLQNAGINELVTDLEGKGKFRFFYDPIMLDTIRVSIKANQLALGEILQLAFKDTDIRYTIDGAGHVFLTRNREIRTELSNAFLARPVLPGHEQEAMGSSLPQPNELPLGTKVTVASTENKLYEIGTPTNNLGTGEATLAGYLRNIRTGEPVIGASVYVADLKTGVLSDQYGFYSITMPRGLHTLLIKAMNTSDTRRQVMLYADGRLNIDLQEQVLSLKEVVISSQKVVNINSVEMGVNKVDIKSIKQVPTVFGEADILRVVLTLPGVQSVGEATTGFNVRGGSADQNLILLNDATIYNPSHFFGFFSAFNPDVVKEVELYKSSIPQKYGGRLSSVLDVINRDGNKKKFTGTAGIGLITSRLNIEGPIDSNRTSFILGGRTTYSNWLLSLLPDEYNQSRASFSDLNLGVSHQIDEKNNIYLSGYYSTDKFKLSSDTTYGYGNRNGSIKWKHNFNNKLFGVFTGGLDRYEYSINSDANPVNAFDLNFAINQTNLKSDFTYYLNNKHTLDFGLSSIYYKLQPGDFRPIGNESLITTDVVSPETALESALYIGDKFEYNDNLSFSAGLRYSMFNYLGPQTVYNYAPGLPKTEINLLDSTAFGKNELVKTYHGPEIRLSGRYSFSDDFSVKAAFNTLRQYIHLLSNTTSIAPTDVYKLSDPNIRPQFGSQVSLGIYKNFKANTIETSVEVYYKNLRDFLDFKSGANLLLNQNIERDVLSTEGKAYGAEFFVRKSTGSLNGWMSYTYSRTLLKMEDPTVDAPINDGNYYPANYDKPHAFNFTGNYRFSHRYSMSFNLTYSTGRPITLPVGKYVYAGSERVYYSDRNAFRIPDYFRSDISINIDGNHKVHQRTHNSWTIGIYNLTGRDNPYSTFFTSSNGMIAGYQLSIFASAIPFVNYNIRF